MTVVMMAVSELEPPILILAVVLAVAIISSTINFSTIASAPVAACQATAADGVGCVEEFRQTNRDGKEPLATGASLYARRARERGGGAAGERQP
jgi:hypothetical protein